jgi:hypothetical protein
MADCNATWTVTNTVGVVAAASKDISDGFGGIASRLA